MGGSSGGSFSAGDMSEIQKAAEGRLKEIASKSTKILFVCEQVDRSPLDNRLGKSKVFDTSRSSILDSSQSDSVEEYLGEATFLVVFTDQATSVPFVESVIDQALTIKIQGVHVQNQPDAFIPTKVTAYRWRSLSWNELEAIFE